MSPEQSPYDAAIADVEARLNQLQVTLDTLRQLRGGAPISSSMGTSRSSSSDVPTIARDTFFGMTVADAARKYLTLVKTTKSTTDIASALESGGLKHSSKRFPVTVRSILNPQKDFVRVNSEWGLTEWYPGMRKEKKAKADKPNGVPEPVAEQKATSEPAKQKTGNLKDRSIAYLDSNPNRSFSGPEVAAAIGEASPSVNAALSALFGNGLVLRPSMGKYQSKRSA